MLWDVVPRRMTELPMHPMTESNPSSFAKLLTVKDVAEMGQWSQRYVWKQILSGNLRASRFSGKLLRIDPRDLTEWIDKARIQPPFRKAYNRKKAGQEVPA